jgi:hypothetical protein
MAPMEDWVVDRCVIDHEMSTKSRGSILPQGGRGSMIGKHGAEGVPGEPVGLEARNAFPLPDSMFDDNEGDTTLHSIYPPEGL